MDITQIILQTGLITREQLQQALNFQKETGGNLSYILCKMRFADELLFAKALSSQTGSKLDLIDNFKIDKELASKFPQAFLEDNLIVPLRREMNTLIVGCALPCPEECLDQLRLMAGQKVESVLVPPLRAHNLLNALYEETAVNTSDATKIKVPHRHLNSREQLTELVQELESEAKDLPPTDPLGPGDLYSFETRELLFGLIKTLTEQGLLRIEDIIEAARGLNRSE